MIQFRATTMGGHAHVQIRAGSDRYHLTLCGNVVFTVDEWEFLKQMLSKADTSEMGGECPGDSEIIAIFDSLETTTSGKEMN